MNTRRMNRAVLFLMANMFGIVLGLWATVR